MRSQRNTALLLCLGLALCANGADASIGDMIKNKVKGTKGAPKAKTAAAETEWGWS